MVVSGAAVGDGGGGSSGVRTSAVKLKSYEHLCEAVHESVLCPVVVTCQCPDKPEISIKILNMRPLF